MQILTKAEFLHCPNGTVFAEWVPSMMTSQIKIKTGYYESKSPDFKGPHWNGELSLEPFMQKECGEISTNWCTFDGADADYDEDQLFAVFNKSEVMQMINCLTWALTGCEGYFDEDVNYESNGFAFRDR